MGPPTLVSAPLLFKTVQLESMSLQAILCCHPLFPFFGIAALYSNSTAVACSSSVASFPVIISLLRPSSSNFVNKTQSQNH